MDDPLHLRIAVRRADMAVVDHLPVRTEAEGAVAATRAVRSVADMLAAEAGVAEDDPATDKQVRNL